MFMRIILLPTIILFLITGSAPAQESGDSPPLSSLKSDYSQVGIVARVKVKSVKFAAPSVHPLYLLQSEIIEPFKGKIKRGQALEFYLAVEEDFDVNSRLGDWVVFLEGSSHSPAKKWGWFALENSSLPYSRNLVAKLRKIKNANARKIKRRSLASHSIRRTITKSFIENLNSIGARVRANQFQR
jgi:hypothetical protein